MVAPGGRRGTCTRRPVGANAWMPLRHECPSNDWQESKPQRTWLTWATLLSGLMENYKSLTDHTEQTQTRHVYQRQQYPPADRLSAGDPDAQGEEARRRGEGKGTP